MDAKILSKYLIQSSDKEGAIILSDNIKETVGILDSEYGADRKSTDMGGYILFFPSEEIYKDNADEVLRYHNMECKDNEYKKYICKCEGTEWWEELYMLSSDDALVMIYPERLAGE